MGDGTEFLRTEEEYQEDQQRFEAEVQQQQQQEHEETMTTNKKDFLNELVKKNHLNINEDIFRKAIRGKEMAFIKRSGIEKIQFTNDIRVKYEVIAMQPDYVVIKAIASMGTDNVFVESFGEATPENTNQKPPYYSAMAEKRALARVVLKICGAYKHGVYGEDEADDFKQLDQRTNFSKDIKGPDTQRKVA
jgi:hypothetical protein